MTDQERYIRDRASVMAMIKFILIIMLITAGCWAATKIMMIMLPFLIGYLLARTSHALSGPITKTFFKNNHSRKLRKRVSLVIYVILLVIFTLLLIAGIIALIEQLVRGVSALSDAAANANLENIGEDLFDKLSVENGGFMTESMRASTEARLNDFLSNLLSYAPELLKGLAGTVWKMIGSLPYWIFVVICVILSGYYFIMDGPAVLRFCVRNIPNRKFRTKTLNLLNNLSLTLFRIIGGYLLLLIITTIEALIAFRLAGVDYAVILALVTGVIDFLPVLGISATMIPVMIYCALNGNFTAIVILAVAMAIMTVIRRLIEPPILGKTMHMHPLMMLLGMAMGVYVWGAIGFLLGPTVMIIIIETIKAFDIDKKVLSYFSVVLGRAMEEDGKKNSSGTKEPASATVASDNVINDKTNIG